MNPSVDLGKFFWTRMNMFLTNKL